MRRIVAGVLLVLLVMVGRAGAGEGGDRQAAGATASGGEGVVDRARPRLLVLGLDGVPYPVVADLADPARGEEALFRGFPPPVPLISTFPSTTNVALAGLLEPLGVPPSPGYEVRYFDRAANEIRGGGPISYHRLRFPWRGTFEDSQHGLLRGMVDKLTPLKASIRDVEAIVEAFAAGDEEVLFAYVGATDGAGHLKSPPALAPVLAALDAALARARLRDPQLRVLLFSDHGQAGGAPLANVRRGARRALGTAGFRITRHLRGPRDVVIPELGMVSSFVAYAAPGAGEEVRRRLAAVPGIELCVSRAGEGGFRVESATGSAWLGSRQGPGGGAWLGHRPAEEREWAYRPETGDPLGYEEVLEGLERAAAVTKEPPEQTPTVTLARSPGEPAVGREREAQATDGSYPDTADWHPDATWLAATARALYPDALYRLARAFDLVVNDASVLCSAARGHMYAARRTESAARLSIGRLRWTHGALRAEASLGFLLTDLPGLEPDGPVRFTEALAPLAAWLEVREKPEAQVTAGCACARAAWTSGGKESSCRNRSQASRQPRAGSKGAPPLFKWSE